MSLPAILLGLLRDPMSGYDLKKEFENGLAHIWSVNLSQIYPTLKNMMAEGWVTNETASSDLGPSRIIYQRTKAGEAKVIEWLKKGPLETNERFHHIAQTYFLYELKDNAQAIAFFQNHLAQLETWQSTMEAINQFWRQGQDDSFFKALPPEDFFPYLTLDLGLRKNKSQIDWCNDCINRIKERLDV
jgi:DNA-binding PadR family transcriptional regulator